MAVCKCGCGKPVKGKQVYVDKEHQLTDMVNGRAREINMMQPLEGKQRGGAVAGRDAVESGRLAEVSKKGGERSREIAKQFREARARTAGETPSGGG